MSKESIFEHEEFEAYINDVKKFNSEQWEKDMNHKLFMENFVPKDYDPGKNISEKIKNNFGVFLNDEKSEDVVTVERDSDRYQGISFGFIDCFAHVSSQSSFLSGTLVLKYDPKKLGSIERDTLHLFKWNESDKFFQLIEPSGVGRDGEYIWARITSPGRYSVIGLNSDPAKMIMLRILSSTTDLLKGLKPEVQKEFLYNIAKMIIGSDPIGEAFKDGSGLLDIGASKEGEN
jgi:hypothetical protein